MDIQRYLDFADSFKRDLVKGNTESPYMSFVEFLSYFEARDYISTNTYGIGSLVRFQGNTYIARNSNAGIDPISGGNTKWAEVPRIPRIYDSRRPYTPSQIFLYNNAVYFLQQSGNTPILKTGDFSLYSSTATYAVGSIVYLDEWFYLAIQEPGNIAPTRENNGYWLPFNSYNYVSPLFLVQDSIDHQIGLFSYKAESMQISKGEMGARDLGVLNLSINTYNDDILDYFLRANQHQRPISIILKRYKYIPTNTGDDRYEFASIAETQLANEIDISFNDSGRNFQIRGLELYLKNSNIPDSFFDQERFPGVSFFHDRTSQGF